MKFVLVEQPSVAMSFSKVVGANELFTDEAMESVGDI